MVNKDTAVHFLPLLQAVAEGKTLQIRPFTGVWRDVLGDITFSNPPDHYRIKPEPKPEPKFKPFTVKLDVKTVQEARALRAFFGGLAARDVEHCITGSFDKDADKSLAVKLTDELFRTIRDGLGNSYGRGRSDVDYVEALEADQKLIEEQQQ